MENKEQQLLKSVADVLDEALAVYDELQKGDSFSNVEHVDDMKSQGKGIVGEGTGSKPAMAKEEMPHEMLQAKPEGEEDEEEEGKDKDESDEKLQMAYKSLVTKMEKRGLMQKTSVQKSEAGSSDLRKSVDERFDALTKSIKEVSETVKKIASQPTARKGVTGYAPLKKSEGEEQPLKKSEVIEKLFELRKSGDKRVDSLLINRIETNRHSAADVQTLRSLNILK